MRPAIALWPIPTALFDAVGVFAATIDAAATPVLDEVDDAEDEDVVVAVCAVRPAVDKLLRDDKCGLFSFKPMSNLLWGLVYRVGFFIQR